MDIGGDGTGATCSAVVSPEKTAVVMGVATSDDASVATTFVFDNPVYLYADTYYAFVVKPPNSLEYTVWTAKLGEFIVGTETRVERQPNLGSLFMSQNGGLWTDDQTQDIKFVLRHAEFETNNVGRVNYTNTKLTERFIVNNPIETNADGTDSDSEIFGDNPSVVRVYHFKHGLERGDLVVLDGVVGNPGGIPNSVFNTVQTVIDSDINTFTVDVGVAATNSAKTGGNMVRCSYNRPYEILNVETGAIGFASTQVSNQVRTTQHAGVNGNNSGNQYTLDNPVDLPLAQQNYFTGPKQVANYLNEAKYSNSIGGPNSLAGALVISTANPFVSPVIDFTRTNALITRNLINSPNENDAIYGTNTKTVTFNSDISAAGLSIGDTLTFNTNRSVRISATNYAANKIQFTGQHIDQLTAISSFSDSTLQASGIQRVSDKTNGTYYPETDNRGSAFAKWISRLFLFENPSSGIEIKVSSIFYSTSDIKLYYKTRDIGYDGEMAELPWIPFNDTGLCNDVEKVTARSSNNINPVQISDDQWQSLTWTTQDIPNFDGLTIKIVMTTENPALCPLLDDVQIICSE